MAGGRGLAHDVDGRVVLVEGALPGERVSVSVQREKPSVLHGTVADVLEVSPDRAVPPCPAHARGCGGCDLQHLAVAAQTPYKVAVVTDALRRLGRVEQPNVVAGPALRTEAFRTTVRAAVIDGAPGLRLRGSRDVLRIESCMVAHPLVDEVLAEGRFPGATEVLVRAGAATGERLVVATPTARDAVVPDGVVVVGNDELRRGHRAWYHEEVAGRRWRISGRSFFQSRADGAEALVEAVRTAIGGSLEGRTLLDAHCGVGLFAGALVGGVTGARVVGVERSESAIADARTNLSDVDATLVRVAFERWKPSPVDVVVADPPRAGLGRDGVERVAATGAEVLVLVSCDVAALGRDVGLLGQVGFVLEQTTLVDLFPHTSHVECVSRFVRGAPHPGGASAPENG